MVGWTDGNWKCVYKSFLSFEQDEFQGFSIKLFSYLTLFSLPLNLWGIKFEQMIKGYFCQSIFAHVRLKVKHIFSLIINSCNKLFPF